MMRVYSNYLANIDTNLELLKKAKKSGKPFTSTLEVLLRYVI